MIMLSLLSLSHSYTHSLSLSKYPCILNTRSLFSHTEKPAISGLGVFLFASSTQLSVHLCSPNLWLLLITLHELLIHLVSPISAPSGAGGGCWTSFTPCCGCHPPPRRGGGSFSHRPLPPTPTGSPGRWIWIFLCPSLFVWPWGCSHPPRSHLEHESHVEKRKKKKSVSEHSAEHHEAF